MTGENIVPNGTLPEKKHPFKLNIGFVIFGIIFIYLTITVIVNLLKPSISVVRVESGRIVDSSHYTGVCLREEEVVNASGNGYINYYVGEGDKVAVDGNVYLLSSQAPDTDTADLTVDTSSAGNYTQIRDAVSVFSTNYSDSQYVQVYSLEYQLQSLSTEFLSAAKIHAFEESGSQSASGSVVPTDTSGIVSYCYDGMEGVTKRDLTADVFNDSGYEKHQTDPYTYIERGEPAYKIVHSSTWSVAIQVSEAEAERLEEAETVTLVFSKENLKTTASAEVLRKDDGIYAILTTNEYMVRYISERYVDIEIVYDEAEGLKIPASSLVKKDFYRIPIHYLIEDNTSYEFGFYCEHVNEEGETVADFRTDAIYYQDDNYFYVSTDEFSLGDYIGKVGTNENGEDTRYRIGATSQLDGVYNVNRGYALFEIVNVLYENGDYCIVQENLNYSVALYDNIVLNGETVSEDQIVY